MGRGYLVGKSEIRQPQKVCFAFFFMGPQTANRRRNRWHTSKPSYFVCGVGTFNFRGFFIWFDYIFVYFYWGFLVGCTKFNWQLKYNIFICPVQTDENPCCHNNMNIICVWAFTLKRFDVMARKSIIGFLRVLRIKGDERINADYDCAEFRLRFEVCSFVDEVNVIQLL